MDRAGIFIGVVAAGYVVFSWFQLGWTSTRRERLARSWLARHHLEADAETLPVAERLLVAQRRGQHVGWSIGFAGVLVFIYVWPLGGGDGGLGGLMTPLVILPMFWLQALVGGIAVALAARPAPDAVRLARAPQPGFDDYAEPWRRWLGPVVMIPVTLLAVAHMVSSPPDSWTTSGGAAVGLGLTVFAVASSELSLRYILRAPLPATTLTELRVHDSLKGETLSIVTSGILPVFVLGILFTERFPGLVGLWPLGVAFAIALVPLESRRQRRMAERLWPVGAR